MLEEEASFDVDLHDDIEDQDSEVRGTWGWCGRLQINLTLGSSTRVVGENHVESYKARACNYWGSKRTDVFWPNLSEQENDAVDHAEALEAVGGWKTTLILRQVTAIKHSEEDSGCTNCLCMENWYRTGCPSVVSQLYNQILQGLLTMLSSLRLA